jgi:plasmid stabilization system protein ParE
MPHKIYPAARRRIIEIWHYTDKTWREKQADEYVRVLYKAIDEFAGKKYMWRKIEHEDVEGVYFVCYEHYYVFFRELSKVALIGMDRSIRAWGKMIQYFPHLEESILDIIAHLERLRRHTEAQFPDARAFIRPGFDEIETENPS